MTTATIAVVLIGHGGVPTDYPRSKLRRLMRMESERRARGGEPSEIERKLDMELRNHPRTAESDPYKYGLEQVAEALRCELADSRLYLAYNEFCAPSVDEAVATAVGDGASRVVLASAMMTPGGSHSEVEIRGAIEALSGAYPNVQISYAWPYDIGALSRFIANHVDSHLDAQLE